MPLYEYECSDCREEFEVLVLDSSEIIKCVKCNSENIGKQFSTFGFGSSSNENLGISESEDSGCCSQSSGCCCC